MKRPDGATVFLVVLVSLFLVVACITSCSGCGAMALKPEPVRVEKIEVEHEHHVIHEFKPTCFVCKGALFGDQVCLILPADDQRCE